MGYPQVDTPATKISGCRCQDCEHCDVCKFRDGFQKYYAQLSMMPTPETPTQIEVKCLNFKKEESLACIDNILLKGQQK